LINIWDVVNEAVDPYAARDPLNWKGNRLEKAFQRIGTVRMIKDMFTAARTANPQATLLINDYRIEPRYKDLLDLLRNNGKSIYDAIGIQSHMHDGVWSSQKLWDICEEYARFGVPLHFTETTIVSGKRLGPGENWGPTDPSLEEKQAKEAERFYAILFGHPAVEAITWWDFTDQGAWQGAAAGFLRKDLSPKPIYAVLKRLIREDWWTKTRLQTDKSGIGRLRTFYGNYQIVVNKDGLSASQNHFHDRKHQGTELWVRLVERN
jgi:GH35 family endo-1,4-beta-xylanase